MGSVVPPLLAAEAARFVPEGCIKEMPGGQITLAKRNGLLIDVHPVGSGANFN